MNYKKIRDMNDKLTLYMFDEEISKNVKGEKIGYFKNMKFIEGKTKFVIISDAINHIERLVFPLFIRDGFKEEDLIKGTKFCAIKGNYCAGTITMMIYGGDYDTIKPHEEYLNDLLMMNLLSDDMFNHEIKDYD